MIVRLKAIKSRENTFCYLSFYLHRSFFWHLVIVKFIILSSRQADGKTFNCIVTRTSARIIAPLDCLQPLTHQGLEMSFILYVTYSMPASSGRNHFCYYYLVSELFKCSFLGYHPINQKLSFLKYERSKTWFTALMNHVITSDHSPGSICVHLLNYLELRLNLLPSTVSTT